MINTLEIRELEREPVIVTARITRNSLQCTIFVAYNNGDEEELYNYNTKAYKYITEDELLGLTRADAYILILHKTISKFLN